MKRNIRKAIEGYWKRKDGDFFRSDFEQLLEITEESYSRKSSGFIYKLIDNSLMAGFEIGYRKALRDTRKKQKEMAEKEES